jgi:hypothetical protein
MQPTTVRFILAFLSIVDWLVLLSSRFVDNEEQMLGTDAMVGSKQRAGGEPIATDKEVVSRLITAPLRGFPGRRGVEGLLPSSRAADSNQILSRFVVLVFAQCHKNCWAVLDEGVVQTIWRSPMTQARPATLHPLLWIRLIS